MKELLKEERNPNEIKIKKRAKSKKSDLTTGVTLLSKTSTLQKSPEIASRKGAKREEMDVSKSVQVGSGSDAKKQKNFFES